MTASINTMIGEIRLVAINLVPRGWAACDGTELSVLVHPKLFDVIGTTYGGNGKTTFKLPDLRGHVPMCLGRGPGLNDYRIGEKVGTVTEALTMDQMPNHNHPFQASPLPANDNRPEGNVLARASLDVYIQSTMNDSQIMADAVQPTGQGMGHNNLQPYLGLNFIIAVAGLMPT